jgi:hypothetical protein
MFVSEPEPAGAGLLDLLMLKQAAYCSQRLPTRLLLLDIEVDGRL